jgi:hypothetical protein
LQLAAQRLSALQQLLVAGRVALLVDVRLGKARDPQVVCEIDDDQLPLVGIALDQPVRKPRRDLVARPLRRRFWRIPFERHSRGRVVREVLGRECDGLAALDQCRVDLVEGVFGRDRLGLDWLRRLAAHKDEGVERQNAEESPGVR